MENDSKNDVAHPEPFTRVPVFNLPPKPGQLTPEQIKHFYDEGYLIVRDFFVPGELEPCRQAISVMVDDLAEKLYNAGKIDSLYAEYGLFQRLAKLDTAFPGANILLFKTGKFPQPFIDLWTNERLLNVVEQFIGPDVAGHPVWNLRVKTPFNDATTIPWHQDCGYFDENSYDHMIFSAWIPFLDTNAHNGGMQFLRRSHRSGRVAQHTCCVGDTNYISIEETEIERTLGVSCSDDLVTCDVPYNGMLLFNNLTVHRSLPNHSDDVRWSIDLRWQSPHERWGFYDIADGVVMRTADNTPVQPDWHKFVNVNRKEIWQKRHFIKFHEVDEFDTTVTGPWMERWPMLHHNRHTDAFRPREN